MHWLIKFISKKKRKKKLRIWISQLFRAFVFDQVSFWKGKLQPLESWTKKKEEGNGERE